LSVRAFRRRLVQLIVIASLAVVVGVPVSFVPEPLAAAYGSLLSGIGLAVVGGALLAMVWVGTYRADRSDVSGRLATLAGYVARAGTWGIAGGGLGALLAQALPERLIAPVTNDPNAIPVGGWMAIIGGALGVGFGLLEEWHQQAGEPPGGTMDRNPRRGNDSDETALGD